MKKLLLMFMLVFSVSFVLAQAISEYAYSTATNGSLEDMSTGTTTILGPGTYYDSSASAVTDIGFSFKLGATIYTQFSANSNGQIRLGSTAVSTATQNPTANAAILGPISSDNAVPIDGKIHYKIFGTSPNRRLVIEFYNLRVYWGSSGGTFSTLQVWLYETSNVVKYVYGTMYNNGTTAQTRGVFISTSNVAGSVGNITTIITTPTWDVAGTSVINTSFPASSYMTNLHSSADGSRRVFTFTPPAPSMVPNPAVLVYPLDSGWAFTNPTLSWTPGSTSGGAYVDSYDVYFGATNPPPSIQNQGGTTYTPATLSPGTPYFWKIVPRNSLGPATDCPVWSFDTPTDLQIAESFENTTFPPTGWTNPGTFSRSTTTPYHLTAGAYKSTTTAAILYTPMLELTETSELNFMARASATTGIGRIQIKHSQNGTNWTAIGDPISMPANTNWNNYVVDLSSLDGDNYYIGFELYSSTSTAAAIYLDHVFGPELAPLTPNPAVLVYPADDSWSFTNEVLQWSAAATGGIPNTYEVYFGETQPPDYIQNQSGTTYTPTLEAGHTYYWQIVPRNDNGSAEDCPVWSFQTPVTTQLAESFEPTTFPPLGWANPGTWTRTTTTPLHGLANAYKSASTTPAIISTPLLAIGVGDVLDFYYRTAATTGYGLMNIKYSTDRVTWNVIGATISMPTTTTWNHETRSLSAITPGNYYLAFEVYTSSSTATIYIDHVIGPELAGVVPGPVTPSTPADVALNLGIRPTFTWTAPTTGGVPTGYKVYCDEVTNPTTLIGTVTDPYTFTYTCTAALDYSTLYYWKIVAYNGTGDAVGNTVRSFTTMTDPTIYTMPWLESFGTTGTTFPPVNWSHYTGLLAATPVTLVPTATGGYLNWAQDNWLNDTTADPVNFSARVDIYSTNRNHWLITPPIQMPGTGYQLEFDLGLTDYASTNPITSDPVGTTGVDDKFVVLISDGNSWTTANAVKYWDNDAGTSGGIYEVYNDVPHTGSHWVLSLDSFTGVKYIAFYGESTISNADNDFFVDNVRIRLAGQEPEFVTLNTPADGSETVDPENAILTWTDSTEGGDPGWYEIYVGENPIDPGNDYYGEFFYESTTNSFNLSAEDDIDLGFETTWYWAVLPFNDYGNPDPNDQGFQMFDFTTLPDPKIVSLPHEEYFDSVTVPALPYGWKSYISSTVGTAYVRTIASNPVTTPNSVYLTNSTDAAADLRLITPQIDSSIPLNTIKLKFFASSSSAGYPLLVGTVNATDATGVFNQIQSISLTATQTEYTISLQDYMGSDQYICFKHGLGGTSRSLYIDNVRLIELQAADLAATSLSGPSFLAGGTSYDYVVSVYNEGTASQSTYDVKLMTGETVLATLPITAPLNPANSAQHTLSWTPSLGGVYQVYGKVVLTGDGNAANDASASKEVYVVDETMDVIQVGDDATTTSGYYVPLYFFDKNGVTEELYFPDEMHLESGTINAIVYKNSFNAAVTKQVKIWMAHTTVTDLTGGWLPSINYTLVYDNLTDFPAGVNYVVIPLETPFEFTGGTLAVRVNNPMDVSFSTSKNWYYTTTPAHTSRSRYLGSDTVTYDPLAPSAAGTTVGYVPNTYFVVEDAVIQTGAVLNGYVYELGGTTPVPGATVTLTDERYTTTTDIDGYYEFTFWENHMVNAVVSKTDYYSSTATGIALTVGSQVAHNFSLQPLPNITVSGVVRSNDYPDGLEGASVSLFGYHNYETTSGVGGIFSIPNVKGNTAGSVYTWEVDKDGYESETGSITTYEVNYEMGSVTLSEYLWSADELIATHEGTAARLVWESAEAPSYIFFDFEDNDGGWVKSASWGTTGGDWEYTNSYNVANFVPSENPTSTVPPTTAHSGDGMWGTKINTNYTNSSGWNYLTQTFDFTGFTNTSIRFWHWNNVNSGTSMFDKVQLKVNGNLVWGPVTTIDNFWQETVVNLAAYDNMPSVVVQFEMYASSVVAYAGWYIDDVYIGPATGRNTTAQLGTRRTQDRWFLNYSVYRHEIGEAWDMIDGAVADTSYLDTSFASAPEGQYEWAVKANYSGGLQSDQIISNILGVVGIPEVENGTVGIVGNNVSINWPAELGASYYVIYGSNDPYAAWPWEILGYSATPSYSFPVGTNAYKFFKVAAADGVMPGSKKN